MRLGVVNDGLVATSAIARVVQATAGLQLAWTAHNGEEAVERCRQDLPDLVLMDIVMPGIDGVEATRRIMAGTPCAILIVTSSVDAHAGKVFEALGAGALDVVRTPILGPKGHHDGGAALIGKINLLRRLIRPIAPVAPPPTTPREGAAPLVVLGASAGGPAALAQILSELPLNFPSPVVIVQHVDAQFSVLMAQWLGTHTRLPVRLAQAGDRPRAGEVLVAGTNDHLLLTARGELTYEAEPRSEPYRPSVDVFFGSVARHWRGGITAVLLTGMGRDGARGLLRLRALGAHTIAQDRASCVVYGMPKAAAELGAAVEVLPLGAIGPRLGTLAATFTRP